MSCICIVVTGAFGALGGAVLERFLHDGSAQVAAIDLAPQAPPNLIALNGSPLVVAGVDLANPGAAEAAINDVASKFGAIDALINLAGGFAWELIASGSPDTWDHLYKINLLTCANMCRAAIPHLIQTQGRIVNVGAGGAIKAAAGMGAYAAAKGGVHRLTEALADELKGKVRVNAVLPSIIDTPLNRRDMPDADYSKWVTPQALAEVIAFLASPLSDGVTGALVPVSGQL